MKKKFLFFVIITFLLFGCEKKQDRIDKKTESKSEINNIVTDSDYQKAKEDLNKSLESLARELNKIDGGIKVDIS